jgi:stress response protein YsnF
MLRSLHELKNYTISALDGDIGRCRDFLFDDEFWTVRYMVADTGKWLPGRKVLLSPISLDTPNWTTHHFPVKLTKEEVKKSPDLDSDAPVSRQYEMRHADVFNWPYYWVGGYAWGMDATPGTIRARAKSLVPEKEKVRIREEELARVHLRSVNEVIGYRISAEDDEFGHVHDFIVEEDVWTIRYLVISTRNWLPGKKVLISPGWIAKIDWVYADVEVNLPADTIKEAPEFNPSEPINREYETRLYDFYGRPKYWE